MIDFSCPSCNKRFRADDELAGRTVTCKQCGSELQVPIPAAPLAPDSPQASSPHPSEPRLVPAAPPAAPTAQVRPEHALSEVLSGVTEHLEYEISQRPDFALVTVRLAQGQKVFAEPSAMASMTPSIKLSSGLKGGLGRTIGRALGGESLIINTFSAEEEPGEVTCAAGAAGDAAYYRLQGNALMLQRGAFMLHSDGVELTGKWQGAKGFFSGEGLVLLKASGTGDLFFNSYGAILAVDVHEEYIVDTGYVVAFEDSLNYKVTVLPGLRAGGKLKSFFFGGEGFVCQFSGQGRVWIQTRHVGSFLSFVNPYRPAKNN